ncbi:hypothetical protein LTR95_008410 [Oleoguttula sp. CCFEE 5521]
MAASKKLSPTAQFFESEYTLAWQYFKDKNFDQANAIAIDVLTEPALGDLHRAGMHLIPAHSPENYVDHAKKALALTKVLYLGREEIRTPAQAHAQLAMIRSAEGALRVALDTEKEYPDTLTDEDLHEIIDEELAEARVMDGEGSVDDDDVKDADGDLREEMDVDVSHLSIQQMSQAEEDMEWLVPEELGDPNGQLTLPQRVTPSTPPPSRGNQ